MIERWLANATEFCVTSSCPVGKGAVPSMPSVSRSEPSFADNTYWRGRSWGPMSFLVAKGLSHYPESPAARRALEVMRRQSKAAFDLEWQNHRRVMENTNSVTGEGCDVGTCSPDANPRSHLLLGTLSTHDLVNLPPRSLPLILIYPSTCRLRRHESRRVSFLSLGRSARRRGAGLGVRLKKGGGLVRGTVHKCARAWSGSSSARTRRN